MKIITKCEFEEECEKASSRLGLVNYSIYVHKDELDMSDKEECNCKIYIIESLKELNIVAEYLTKKTLDDTNEVAK